MLTNKGLKSFRASMVRYTRLMLLPLSGGNNSKEKAGALSSLMLWAAVVIKKGLSGCVLKSF
jgi:hypothetical protein